MASMLLGFLSLITLVARSSAVAITGPLGGVNETSGERPFRLEFSVFKDSGPAFDLFIQALYYFEQEDQDNLLSYFQVAGIHGYPFIPWDGVDGNYRAGYCTHGSSLFPSWHRPYLALFEQVLWGYAQDVAATYPPAQRDEYQAAARTLRVPYWDWALDARMPDLVNTPTISINLPEGPCNCPNPLYEYVFHPLPSDPDFPIGTRLNDYARTVRSPDGARQSQPEVSNQRLEANANAIATLTYQLIASQTDFGPFSNTAFSDGRGGQYNNVENIHNAIHSFIGNGGHMSNIPYSSYDPIFWLHHASVDRLIAIWQAVHPDSYTVPQANAVGTFTEAPGFVEDVNTPLTPFHSDDAGTLYTSASVRSTRSFGYSYPEIVDWGVSATQLTLDVQAKFNALYNPTGSIQARSRSSKRGIPAATSNAADLQWVVNIRIDKLSLPSSFYIHFFLGDVPTSAETWAFAPNLVASHAVLAPLGTTTANQSISYGQIPLTTALLHSGGLLDLKPWHVIPFLLENLHWRLQTFTNVIIDTEAVPSLKLYVAAQKVFQPEGIFNFPTYGPWIPYREITDGKAGALGDDDHL